MTSDEIIFENKFCKNEFDAPGSCPKKGSSLDNSFETINNTQNGHTTNTNILSEMNNLVLSRPEFLQYHKSSDDFAQSFFDNIKQTVSDQNILSHARFVHKTLKRLCLLRGGQEEYLPLLKNKEFIMDALNELRQTKSLKKRKWMLWRLCNFFFANQGYNPMDPSRISVIRTIELFNKSSVRYIKSDLLLHPYVMEFVDYITEKNFKWQRSARFKITYVLKWHVENNYVSAKNHWEIDVREISRASLLAFRKHLKDRIKSRSLKKQSAQTYIQYIRKWCAFLRLNNYVFINFSHCLKNFDMREVESDLVLLTLQEFDNFFKAIFQHSKDVLRDMALFSIMATMGLRASEVLSINKADINLVANRINFVHKGGAKEPVPLSIMSRFYLELYCKSISDNQTEFWLNERGTRLQYHSVLKLFHKYARLSGLDRNVGACHAFRRLLISELCYEGYSLDDLKNFARLVYKKTLDHYVLTREKEVLTKFSNNFQTLGGEFDVN